MYKRGMSHIEEILAFFLFIGTIIFMMYMFNVPKTNINSDLDMDEIFLNMEKSIVSPFIVQAIKINESTKNNLSITFNSNLTDYKVHAISYNGTVINASMINASIGKICLRERSGYDNLPSFIYVYLSKDLNETSPASSCTEESENKSSFAASYTILTFSDSSIINLKNKYDSNYSELKTLFKIPSNQNFGFAFEFGNGTEMVAERSVPIKTEIITKDYKITVLSQANKYPELANLKIKLW